MFIVSVSQLTSHELHQLGHNVAAEARHDRDAVRDAVNRSLAVHQERVGRDDEIDAMDPSPKAGPNKLPRASGRSRRIDSTLAHADAPLS